MPATVEEWSDQHFDRTFARQSAQVDTVKLLVTFALGFAATLVATSLQVGSPNDFERWASYCLGASFVLALLAIFLDRLKWPNRTKALAMQARKGWSDAQLLEYVRDAMDTALAENNLTVRIVRHIAEYQVILSGIAATLAVLSLLR